MSKSLFICVLIGLAGLNNGSPDVDSDSATSCNRETCLLPSCRCSGVDIPGGLLPAETPQFIMLTFDDAITPQSYQFFSNATFGRLNHNGCPVAATYYVSHEWTDYTLVHSLYSEGSEIATHSITHTGWLNADIDVMVDEFAGARTIFSHFGNIPYDDIQGVRLPSFQMHREVAFQMMYENNFTYDASWPTQQFMGPGMWPYTLDHLSTQDCFGVGCPTESWPGVWVMPMIVWRDRSNFICAMLDACLDIPRDDVDELVEFMMENFYRTYNTNRAPMGVYLSAAWFLTNPINFEAYVKFIERVQELDDVFLVSASTVLDWVKDPVPVEVMRTTDWNNCRMPQSEDCNARVCSLLRDEEIRYMPSCVTCPDIFPWLGNPMGNAV